MSRGRKTLVGIAGLSLVLILFGVISRSQFEARDRRSTSSHDTPPNQPDNPSPEGERESLGNPEQPISVSVRVIDSTKRGVPNARIEVPGRHSWKADTEGQLLVSLPARHKVTLIPFTANGKFQGRGRSIIPLPGMTEVEVPLPVASFEGHVIDDDAKPVPGASVLALPNVNIGYITEPNLKPDRWPLTTDADTGGNFVLQWIPCAVEEDAEFEKKLPYTIAVSAPGFESSTTVVEVRAGEKNETTLRIRRAQLISITGVVKDTRGNLLAGATVCLVLVERDAESEVKTHIPAATTDAKGVFTISFPLSSYWNEFLGHCVLETRREDFSPSSLNVGSNPKMLTQPLLVVLEDGQFISGKIVDEDGAPITEATVVFVPCGETVLNPISAKTGSDGTYRCNGLAPRAYDIIARLPSADEAQWETTSLVRKEISAPQSDVNFRFKRMK